MNTEREDDGKTKRRNTAIFRRNSIKSETNSVASCRTQSTLLGSSSSNSTPKKTPKIQTPDLCVTGKQFLKNSERASSTGVLGRRKSVESVSSGCKNYGKKGASLSQSYLKGRCTEMTVAEDLTLDISEISVDKNDTATALRNKRQLLKKKMPSVATSTPRNLPSVRPKPRSASVQAVCNTFKMRDPRKCGEPVNSSESSRSVVTYSSDSVIKGSNTTDTFRSALSTDLDNSPVSPECSQSSCEMSPRTSQPSDVAVVSPFSPRSHLSASSSFYSSWIDTNTDRSQQMGLKENDIGEWNEFWSNYNNSNKVPIQNYYDLCPTPYRSESIGVADLDFLSDETLKEPPQNVETINEIIRNDGIHLTPRETQNLIKCTHILTNVISKAFDRNAKEKRNATEEKKISELLRCKNEIPKANPEYLTKKSNLTLDLKEQLIPLKVKPEITFGTLGTQTDISLPNTKSAPRIFEKILRQLSKTSIDEKVIRKTESVDILVPVNICEGNVCKTGTNDIDEVNDKSDKQVAPSVEKPK